MDDKKIEKTEETNAVLSEDELDKVAGGVVGNNPLYQGAAKNSHSDGVHQSGVHSDGKSANILKL